MIMFKMNKIFRIFLIYFHLFFNIGQSIHQKVNEQNSIDYLEPKFVNIISPTLNITCYKSNLWNNLEKNTIQSKI